MLYGMQEPKKYPQGDLAIRLRSAMDDAKLTQADLARACGVTIQAVHGWRENGRIGKQHLWTICKLTGKSLEYFLLGLSRMAVVAFLSFCVIFAAQVPDAAVFPRFNSNTDCRHFLARALAWLTRLVSKLLHSLKLSGTA
jgi:transcriptional regulator with XRE-family HTH domain